MIKIIQKKGSTFESDADAIRVAKEVLQGRNTDIYTYDRIAELPEDEINKLIKSAKKLDKSNRDFQKKAGSLVILIN